MFKAPSVCSDVVLESAVLPGGCLEAVFQPLSRRLRFFLAWLGLIIFASALALSRKSCLDLDFAHHLSLVSRGVATGVYGYIYTPYKSVQVNFMG